MANKPITICLGKEFRPITMKVQAGPSLDSELMNLNLQPETKLSLTIQEECIAISLEGNTIFLPLFSSAIVIADRLTPFTGLVLAAQGRIEQTDMPEEIKIAIAGLLDKNKQR